MNTSLDWNPKVVRISSAFDEDRLKVVGALHAVWSVFDAFTEDGRLVGYTPGMLDQKIGLKGFSRAMMEVGWLIENNDKSLSMKDFEEHNGKSAKRRSMEKVRKMSARIADKNRTDGVTSSASNRDEIGTREDKRRIYTPIVPKGTSQGDRNEESAALSRAKMLFRMRDSTPLDSSEERAWKKNKGVVELTSEADWLLLEWLYAQGKGRGEAGEFRRKDLAQLLNNWNGAIRRASEEAEKRGIEIGQKKEKEGIPEPEGWREALLEIFDDTSPEDVEKALWRDLPASVRSQIIARMDSTEGGAA